MMSLFGGDKKQSQSTSSQQTAILQREDANKSFGSVGIKRSLEIAIIATTKTQAERSKPYVKHRPEPFDSLSVHKSLLEGFVTAVGAQGTSPQRLNLCKQSICDVLADLQVHKNYLLAGIAKDYLPFKKTVDMLLGPSFGLLTPDEIAVIINSINYQTGQNTEHLQQIIHIRQTKNRTDDKTVYIGTLSVAQLATHPIAKDALLHSIPSNATPTLYSMLYNEIKQTRPEHQKALMEHFFFEKGSTMNIKTLIRETHTTQGIQAVAQLMTFLDTLYGETLQTKEPGIEEYIASLTK